MKKLYFLFCALLITLLSFGQTVTITKIVDGGITSDGCSGSSGASSPKVIELYIDGTIDFTGYTYDMEANGGTISYQTVDLTSFGSISNQFVYIIALGETTFNEILPGVTTIVTTSATFNGNDYIRITDGTNILDEFGVLGEDGSGTPWEYLDTYVSRNDGVSSNPSFTIGEWTFGVVNELDGVDCATLSSKVNFGSYTTTVSTTPSLTINSPGDGSTLPSSASTTMDVSFTIQNFTVATAGNGDGHIHYTVDGGGMVMKFDADPITLTGLSAGAHTVFMELVDDSHTALNPAVNQTVNFSIDLPCDLSLVSSAATCDASTAGVDSYTATVDFTGGNTGITYTVSSDSGTVGGDDPSTTSSGTITVTGVNEGTDIVLTVVGGAGSSCDLTRNISSPVCRMLPFVETFSYTVATNLGDVVDWENNNSGDEMIIGSGSLSYSGLKPSAGNAVSFDGAGMDPSTPFSITSGTAYASFIFRVTDQTAITDLTDGGYFAVLGNFDARLWVRPNPDASGTTFDIGFGNGSSNPPVTSSTYNIGDDIFVVMSYEVGTGNINAWINPADTDFSGTAPASTISGVDASPATSINQFLLRQDSTIETPFMIIDELRIGMSWADVTPNAATASVRDNDIPGFNMFPNPVINGVLTINTFTNADKVIQIFDILGKQVLSTNLKGRKLNISKLNSGIYILKILEEGKTATRKLVIK